MTPLITKAKSAISTAALFVAACVMAGVGFAVLGTLAFFALFAIGVGLLAAPFAALAQTDAEEHADAQTVA